MSSNINVTLLVENSAHERGLKGERGLAWHIQSGSHRVLFDTGQTDLVMENARRLGVPLHRLDAIVLSHGHYDHTGGLAAVAAASPCPPVFLHPAAREAKFSLDPDGTPQFIGLTENTAAMLARTETRIIETRTCTEVVEVMGGSSRTLCRTGGGPPVYVRAVAGDPGRRQLACGQDAFAYTHFNKPRMTNQMTPELPDGELVQRAKAGDLDAFELLTTRHEQRVYSLAMRMLRQEQDAEDVTQQTFLSVLENLDGFRGEASFSTWLLRIATHAALKIIRKRKGLAVVSLEEATEPADHSDSIPHPEFIADWRQSPGQLAQSHEVQRLLDEALARLDEKHRVVFLLRDVEGLSIKETAEALGLSEANTKVRLLRARLQLREDLTRTLGDPATQLVRSHHHEP